MTERKKRRLAAHRAMRRVMFRDGVCVYCGEKVLDRGTPNTCSYHRDLVNLDPFYDEWVAA